MATPEEFRSAVKPIEKTIPRTGWSIDTYRPGYHAGRATMPCGLPCRAGYPCRVGCHPVRDAMPYGIPVPSGMPCSMGYAAYHAAWDTVPRGIPCRCGRAVCIVTQHELGQRRQHGKTPFTQLSRAAHTHTIHHDAWQAGSEAQPEHSDSSEALAQLTAVGCSAAATCTRNGIQRSSCHAARNIQGPT
jgi:hypothetical protein